MKFKLLSIGIFLSLIQCTVDQDETIDSDSANLSIFTNEININQTPNPVFDTSQTGLYQGIVASHDLAFHEKITINLGNDKNYSAYIIDGDRTIHTFKGYKNPESSIVTFKGALGHFNVHLNPESFTTAINNNNTIEVTDAIINQTEASIVTFKDRSTARATTSLGSFTSNDGSITGTWDFTFVASSSLGFSIPTLTIVRDGGSTFVLDTNGDYQRLCSAPGTPVPIGVVNSSFFNIQSSNSSIELAGATLNYTIVGNRLEATNAGCRDFPSAPLNISNSNWTWNGIQGTATIDTSSLPDFSGI